MSVDLMARMLKSSPATSVSRMLSGRRTVVRAKASSEMFSHCRLRSVRRVSRETKKARVGIFFQKCEHLGVEVVLVAVAREDEQRLFGV